jgi:hypothetical protein
MQLPELDRETILFERQERRRDMEERNKLRLENRKQKREEMGMTAEPSRKKLKTSQRAALDDLKKKRSKVFPIIPLDPPVIYAPSLTQSQKEKQRDDLYDDDDEVSDEEYQKKSKKTKKIYGDDEDDNDFMDIEEEPRKPKTKSEPREKLEMVAPAEPRGTSASDHLVLSFFIDHLADKMGVEEANRQLAAAALLQDFGKVVVKRSQVEKWYGEPFWNEVIRVRLFIVKNRLRSYCILSNALGIVLQSKRGSEPATADR